MDCEGSPCPSYHISDLETKPSAKDSMLLLTAELQSRVWSINSLVLILKSRTRVVVGLSCASKSFLPSVK